MRKHINSFLYVGDAFYQSHLISDESYLLKLAIAALKVLLREHPLNN